MDNEYKINKRPKDDISDDEYGEHEKMISHIHDFDIQEYIINSIMQSSATEGHKDIFVNVLTSMDKKIQQHLSNTLRMEDTDAAQQYKETAAKCYFWESELFEAINDDQLTGELEKDIYSHIRKNSYLNPWMFRFEKHIPRLFKLSKSQNSLIRKNSFQTLAFLCTDSALNWPFDLDTFNCIDLKTKLLVMGWIRNNTQNTIYNGISQICAIYYFESICPRFSVLWDAISSIDAADLFLQHARQLYEFDFRGIETPRNAFDCAKLPLIKWMSKSPSLIKLCSSVLDMKVPFVVILEQMDKDWTKWDDALNEWAEPLKLAQEEKELALKALKEFLTQWNIVKNVWNQNQIHYE